MDHLLLKKFPLFPFLIIMLCACSNRSLSRVSMTDELVIDSVSPSSQTDNERKEIRIILDSIDNYIAKHEQIVLEIKPQKVYQINIPKDLLDRLDEGDLWKIDMYYLGELSSSKLKVLFESAVYGYSQYSPHGRQKLLIYNNQNKLLGHYRMSMMEIPEIVSGDSIRFNSSSDCNIITTLSFKDIIPSEIFVRCTEKGGDIYSFDKIENR